MNPDGNVTIIICAEVINVEVTFNFKNENESIRLNALNEFRFPNSETNFALI